MSTAQVPAYQVLEQLDARQAAREGRIIREREELVQQYIRDWKPKRHWWGTVKRGQSRPNDLQARVFLKSQPSGWGEWSAWQRVEARGSRYLERTDGLRALATLALDSFDGMAQPMITVTVDDAILLKCFTSEGTWP